MNLLLIKQAIVGLAVCSIFGQSVVADVIYKPGSLSVEAASGMVAIEQAPWTFQVENYDPYTKAIKFPSALSVEAVKAIGIELEKNEAKPGERVELFLILNNEKGITLAQRLDAPLQGGRHRYLFEISDIRWLQGKITGIRIDPGTAPGEVSIKSIGIFTSFPEEKPGDVKVPVPEDQKSSLGASHDTFPDAVLVRYRLFSDQIDFAILDAYEGLSKVLKLHVRNSSQKDRPVSLSFASTNDRIPFFPVIPPYVGLDAERVGLMLRIDSPGDLNGMAIKVGRQDKSFEIFRVEAGAVMPEKWQEFSWQLAKTGDLRARVTSIDFVCDVPPGANAFVYIAKPFLEMRGQKEAYDLLTTQAPMMTTGMIKPLATEPARALPTRDSLALGGFDITDPEVAQSLPTLEKFIKQEFPQWDFILSPVWTPPLDLYAELPQLPEGFYFQFQKAKADSAWLHAIGAMPLNGYGEILQEFGNGVMATHPAIQAGLKDQIDYAASLGVNNFKQVDMVWPWQGRWGYDEVSVAAFRDDLQETDEGLDILPGLTGKLSKGGVIHFWDYYEYYHGFRLKPSDLGLKSWMEYTPVSERAAADGGDLEKRNLGVFILLYHYEWLRQAQRFGRWAKAHGGIHDYTLNPEDLGNGGDYVFLSRIADAGTIYVEYFGGPSALQGAYHNLPLYVHSADAAGRKLGLILEIGQGGHGEHYLAPEVNYLYAFELAAAGLRNYHNEWTASMWRAISASPPAVPEQTFDFDRWSSWVSGALGFVFAREEKIRRPEPRVFNISTRSPGYYVSSWLWGLNQGPSFGPLLSDWHVPFQQWDRSAMPEILGKADVIFYTPPAGRTQDWKALREWLKQPGKSLVIHSNVPFSIDDGQARLAPGVENVNYTSVDQRYTDFLAEKVDYQAALFPELKAIRSLEDRTWSAIPGAEVLAGDRNKLLLSLISLPGGSSIWYLHRNPLELEGKDCSTVEEILVGRLKLPRDVAASSAPVMAHRFAAPGYEVLNVWTGLDIPGFKAGYGPHLMPGRGANEFDPKKRPYPYLLPEVDTTVEVPVKEAGDYRVYAFLSGQENVLKASTAGVLELRVRGTAAEQFFFAKDGPDFQKALETVKHQRARLLPYGPDLPRSDTSSSTR